MTYIPTLEQLQVVGHFQLVESQYPKTIEYVWYQDAHDAPGFEWRVFVHEDNSITLCSQGGWVIDGTGEDDGCLFSGTCPDEQFFNQLLSAIGWQPVLASGK
jgi:hypothetical protein